MKRMTNEELENFIYEITKYELYDEVKLTKKCKDYPVGAIYSRAICVTLRALGYDEYWIDKEVKKLIEKKYYTEL